MTFKRREWSDDQDRSDRRTLSPRPRDQTGNLATTRDSVGTAAVFAAIGNRAAARIVSRMDEPPERSGHAPEKPHSSSDQPRRGTLHRDGKAWSVAPDEGPRSDIKVRRLSGVRLTKARLADGTRCTYELDEKQEAWHIDTDVKKEKRGQTVAPDETPLQKLERETAQLLAQLLQLDEAACKKGALKVTEARIPRSVADDLRGMLNEFNQAQKLGGQKASALLDLYPLYIRILQYVVDFGTMGHPLFLQLARCGFIKQLAAAASGSCHNMQTGPLLDMLDYIQKS